MQFPENAYRNPAIRGARDMEYDVFAEVTRALLQAPAECHDRRTITAVSRNNELWTVLSADLQHPENGLDAGLRANLISLAQFSLRHGQNVLAGQATTEVLIDINKAVMKGLRSGGAA
ncbi:flagellar biosynthesis regulator FlaF [Paracoccus ravus]|uniref:flagellar biosynthesis regulator FlaF n=1 Tax=Paracoccus ravus TaxID=2447760 RepID=UPI00106EFBDD|nr:flagellar biosynthesis regulator FlaF [Paracoccus ravus]